jgi:8-oxo-dGTP pyrophosphatase MutT (NUDIX family)
MDGMSKMERAADGDPFDPDPSDSAEHPVEQAGAICLRRPDDGGVEALLVASRTTGYWGIPKGHIETGEMSHHTAGREAFEEAGVLGQIAEQAVGSFIYYKRGRSARYRVAVHLLRVEGAMWQFPERHTRRMKWVPLALAGQEVANPQLAEIFDRIKSKEHGTASPAALDL